MYPFLTKKKIYRICYFFSKCAFLVKFAGYWPIWPKKSRFKKNIRFFFKKWTHLHQDGMCKASEQVYDAGIWGEKKGGDIESLRLGRARAKKR